MMTTKSRFDTTPGRDRQTDGQMDRHSCCIKLHVGLL